MCVRTTAWRPPAAHARRPPSGSGARGSRSARGAAAWPRPAAGRCRGRTRRARRPGRQSAPKVNRAPFASASGCRPRRSCMKWGTSRKRGSKSPPPSAAIRVVLLELEGVLDQILVAPAADHPPEDSRAPGGAIRARSRGAVGAGPRRHGNRLLARGVGERVGVGDEVEDVVGVQVADEHARRARCSRGAGGACRRRRCRSRGAATSRRPGPGSRCTRPPASCQEGDLPRTVILITRI